MNFIAQALQQQQACSMCIGDLIKVSRQEWLLIRKWHTTDPDQHRGDRWSVIETELTQCNWSHRSPTSTNHT